MINFILRSDVADCSAVEDPESDIYRYRQNYKAFKSVLGNIGKLVTIEDPTTEVDQIYKSSLQEGNVSFFLSFHPPHESPTDLACPTLCFVDWGLNTLPSEMWDEEPRHDWRYVFAKHKKVICLSSEAANLIDQEVGDDVSVLSLVTPVWDKFSSARALPCREISNSRVDIHMAVPPFDSREYSISAFIFEKIKRDDKESVGVWGGEKLEMPFSVGNPATAYLEGFYNAESWGVWSKVSEPSILVPYLLDGKIELSLSARGYGENVAREIQVQIGDKIESFILESEIQTFHLSFHLDQPASKITFLGLDVELISGASDSRTLGIGLERLVIESGNQKLPESSFDQATADLTRISVDGVIYTAVFNPADLHTNWQDIITAFCYVFGKVSDATLILKLTHHSAAPFSEDFQLLLQQLMPLECRIILMYDPINEGEYSRLIAASTYYVQASSFEGHCLSMLEFMSLGTPVISPCHSAMADYVDSENHFVVKSHVEPCSWPHDSRNFYRAFKHRVDWASLVSAYEDSYRVVKEDLSKYQEMSNNISEKLSAVSTENNVKEKIVNFLQLEHDAEELKVSGGN